MCTNKIAGHCNQSVVQSPAFLRTVAFEYLLTITWEAESNRYQSFERII